MNCKQIVEKYLRENGFDGLAGEDCGCGLDDLFACSEYYYDCVAARKVKYSVKSPCPCGEDCDHHFEGAEE